MKQYILLGLLALATGMIHSCVEDPQMPDDIKNALAPEVITGEPSDETATTVSISGTIEKENGASVTTRGFLWGTKTPVTMENKTDSMRVPTSDTHFSAIVTGLGNNKTYYIAAFAGNIAGTTIGETKVFKTNEGLGSMETLDVDMDSVKAESAVVGGHITDPGEGQIKERGVYYWKEGAAKKDTVQSTMQTDSYTCQLTGLTPNTNYFVLAYAMSEFGTIEGSESKTFKTPDGKPTISLVEQKEVEYTYADFTATVLTSGDAPVTVRGFCYGTTVPEPTITGDTIQCGEGTGEFSGRIKNLLANQKYYVRAYVVNTYGVVYSKNTLEVFTKNDSPTVVTKSAVLGTEGGTIRVSGDVQHEGKSAITAAGVCWSTTSEAPTLENGASLVMSATLGVFNGTIPNLRGGQTYYIRAYASNSTNTSYGEKIAVTTPSIFKNMAAYSGESLIAGSVGCFLIENEAYLFGGDTGPSYTDAHWKYNPSQGWSQQKPFLFKNAWMTAVGYDKAAFVLGGRDESNALTNKFTQYTRENNVWTNKTSSAGSGAVARAAGCRFNLSVYYIGGIRKDPVSGAEVVSDEVWRFIPITDTWSRPATTNFPEKQYGGFAFVANETMYCGFGITSLGTSLTYTNKLMRSVDNNADAWVLETTMPGGNVLGATVHKGQLFVVDNQGYIWRYDFGTKEWQQKSRLPNTNPTIQCMYSIRDVIYIGMNTNLTLIAYDPVWDN